MASCLEGLASADLSKLINEQLAAFEQVVAISGELARRLQGEDDSFTQMAAALRLGRRSMERNSAETELQLHSEMASGDDRPHWHSFEDSSHSDDRPLCTGAHEMRCFSHDGAEQELEGIHETECLLQDVAPKQEFDGSFMAMPLAEFADSEPATEEVTVNEAAVSDSHCALDSSADCVDSPLLGDVSADPGEEPPDAKEVLSIDGTLERSCVRARTENNSICRRASVSDCRKPTELDVLPRAQTDSELFRNHRRTQIEEEQLHPLLDALGPRANTDQEGRYPQPASRAQARRTEEGLRGSPQRSGGLFGDKDEMKEQLRKLLEKKAEDMEDHWHETGYAQAIARHEHFKHFTFIVITFSCVWIAVDTDYNKPDATETTKVIFTLVDNMVLLYFAFEIGVRWAAFRDKSEAFGFFDFTFDLVIVCVMIFDTWLFPVLQHVVSTSAGLGSGAGAFRILRLFRLMRLTRLGRLLRYFPDVVVLARGMITAMRAVLSTLLIIAVIIYVFAIVFSQTLSDEMEGFGTVLEAMVFLFMGSVFPDSAHLLQGMLDVHWIYFICMSAYLSLCCLAGMNLLTGVIVEVVTKIATAEQDARVLIAVQEQLHQFLVQFDHNDRGMICASEFRETLKQEDFVSMLADADIDVYALAESGELIIFRQAGDAEMPFVDFIEALMKFRNTNMCTVKDAVDVRMSVIHTIKKMEDRILLALRRKMEDHLTRVTDASHSPHA